MIRFKLPSFFKIALIIFIFIICFQPSFISAQDATDSATLITPIPTAISDFSPIEANKSAILRPSFKLENDTPTTFHKTKPEFRLVSGTRFRPNIKVYNHQNQEVDVKIIEKTDKADVVYSIDPAADLPPGEYRINFQDELGGEINQNFYWGVLAINFNKSIYHPLENSYISLAVLDETGDMVCDALLTLTVEKPDGTTDNLSTKDNRIKVNSECLIHGYTEKPDYETEYAFGQNLGTYKFHLTAETKNGSYSIDDQIQVADNIPIEVDRIMATRIYPPAVYSASINLKANEDFHGVAEESVPLDFIITQNPKSGTQAFIKIVEDQNTSTKKIQWNLDLLSGEEITLGYQYDIPDISPELYFVGPMKFTDFSGTVTFFNEARQWQLAADADEAKIRQEINIIDGLVTVGGTDAAIINLDTTKYGVGTSYYFEVIAKVASGTLTVNLSTGATNTVGIGVSTTSFVRLRKVFTPETGSFDYRLNLVNGTTPQVKVARVIILQNATKITATQTQIEIGNLEVGLTMATTLPLASPKYWKYDSSLWDGTLTFGVDISYKAGINVTAATITFNTPGSNTFTAPIGVTSVYVEAWGGGGAGGLRSTAGTGGGGGGGAYANKLNIAVNGGVGYTAFVGRGSTSSVVGIGGSDSYFISALTLLAKAGIGVSNNSTVGGTGGFASASVGDTKWNGGRGAIGIAGTGGGGGGAAGDKGAGGNGSNVRGIGGTGGAGIGTSGGFGGLGRSGSVGAGDTGGPPGGGGGGGYRTTSSTRVGGNGGNGRVKVTYLARSNAVTIYLQEDNGSFGGWANVFTILSNGTAPVATHIGVTGFTPTNGRNYRLVVATNGVPFNIYNAKIVVTQTSATALTKLQPQYLLLNTESISVGATLGYQTYWDSAEWLRTTNVYKHAMDAIGAGASSSLVDINNSNIGVSFSPVVGQNQVISNGLTMPTTGHQIDTWLQNAGTEVDASRILVNVNIDPPPAQTVSGNIYIDEIGTAYNCTGGNTKTVKMTVNGANPQTADCIAADGSFTVSGLSLGSTSDVITVFLDGEAEKATTITKPVNVGSTIIGLNLYQNRLYLTNQNNTPITNTNIGQCDSACDSDNQFTVSGGALTVASGTKLVIKAAEAYLPGGNVTVDALEVGGTLYAEANTINLRVGGTGTTCTASSGTVMPFCGAGTFNPGASTVNFLATSAATIGGTLGAVVSYGIGSSYQGGLIAYILQVGDSNYDADRFRGLIVAPTNTSSAAAFGCNGVDISGAAGTAIGTGYQNTLDMIGAGCTNAAQVAVGYTGGGYTDWYLPSKDELNQLYLNRVVLGLGANYYRTSTEADASTCWEQYFLTGVQGAWNKTDLDYVRAVRTFDDYLPSTTTYYNLGVGTSSETGVGTTFTLINNVSVGGTLTVGHASSTNTDVLSVSSNTLSLTGSGTPLNVTSKGSFSPATSTVEYLGLGSTVTAANYYNLTIGSTSVKTITRLIAASSDDAGEDWTCSPVLNGSEISQGESAGGNCYWFMGMRFTNITIGRSATIDAAKISVYSAADYSSTVYSRLYSEAVDDSATFSAGSMPLGRTKSVISVGWTINTAWSNNNWYDSISLVPLIQDRVNQVGWASGQDISLLAETLTSTAASAERRWYSYDRDPKTSTTLEVTYHDPAISTFTLGPGTFSVASNFVIKDSAGASHNNPVIDINGNFTISSGAAFTASQTSNLGIGGSFTNSGTFTANSGKVTFDDASKTSVISYAGVGSTQPFYNLFITTPGKIMQFDETEMTGIGGSLYVQGSNCTTGRVSLDSFVNGNKWDIKVTGSADVNYAYIEDSNAINALTANNSSGTNNTNWTLNACGGVASPILDQLMRHGTWFYNGLKQPFTF